MHTQAHTGTPRLYPPPTPTPLCGALRRYAPDRERAALLWLVAGDASGPSRPARPGCPESAVRTDGACGAQGAAAAEAGRLIDLRYLPCDWSLALSMRTAPLAPSYAAHRAGPRAGN